MAEPFILETNPKTILAEWVAAFETQLGTTLNPAQIEYFLATGAAYRETVLREVLRSAILQNYLDYSTAPVLDYIAALVGVTRLGASAATTTLQFNCTVGHGGVIIPAGTTVRTTDGGAVFATDTDLVIVAGVLTATVQATATIDGGDGNGYLPGIVSQLQTPIASVVSVSNTTTTGGGAVAETDAALRGRIKLAPSQYSTAGSADAYKFHALSAHPDIIDVSVPLTPSPAGTVNIYVLATGGVPAPTGVLQAVTDACSAKTVRPLTDTVIVQDVTEISYLCAVNLTVLTDVVQADVQAAVEASLASLLDTAKNTIGKDVTLSKIIKAAMQDGVYSVGVGAPNNDIVVGENEVAVFTNIVVNITGTANG